MAQSLEVNIKTTSDVPQAMNKATSAVSGFGKQIDDIQKKFGTSFKDIFLSFLGPMAILSTVISVIGKMIADNQKKREEAHQAAINETNELMSAEDRYYEKRKANEKKFKETKEEAKLTREEVTKDFLLKDPRGKKMVEEKINEYPGEKNWFNDAMEKENNKLKNDITLGYYTVNVRNNMAEDKAIQDKVQAIIAQDAAEEAKKNPPAPTGPTSFKGPEGFGNVVGVGANPVMEAMTLQLEEARKQTALLESLNNKSPGGGVPVDFTKPQPLNAASRSGSI